MVSSPFTDTETRLSPCDGWLGNRRFCREWERKQCENNAALWSEPKLCNLLNGGPIKCFSVWLIYCPLWMDHRTLSPSCSHSSDLFIVPSVLGIWEGRNICVHHKCHCCHKIILSFWTPDLRGSQHLTKECSNDNSLYWKNKITHSLLIAMVTMVFLYNPQDCFQFHKKKYFPK